MHPLIQAQLDNQRRGLDSSKEVVEKAVNIKIKPSLQPPSKTRKIDFRYPKGYRPTKKDESSHDKQDHQDENKAKSTQNPILTNNISQPPI